MAYQDLQEFLAVLRTHGEITTIEEPVSPRLEVSEICDRVVKSGGPALLFTHLTKADGGRYPMPLLINTFGSERRMTLALEVERLDDLAAEIASFLEPEIPESLVGKIRMVPKLARLSALQPKAVTRAACQEMVETKNPSLADIPIITCWPMDAGPYITLPLVFTRHPDLGTRNIGMYRLQVFDDKTLGMHWQLHKGGAEHFRAAASRGERMPVAIALGPSPALIYAATAPLPPEIDELMLAGFIQKKSVEMVRCVSIDMEVPASSQIVLEGYVDPSERRVEGPFGDHTGFYSLADSYPVFHLTAVTRRRDPIYPTIIVGPPPMEDAYLGLATERLFLPLIKKVLPEVVDVWLPPEGIFHNLAILKINKRYPGHARKVIHAVWGLGQLMFTKIVIVVDADCDIRNPAELVWRVGTHIDAKRDIVLSEGPLDVLDFAGQAPAYGGKLGIDATRKMKEEGFTGEWPPIIRMDPEVIQRIDALWPKLGLRPPGRDR
ncbi:MAG TPA: menaquinone biosynthesis decarboxylase [Candidatus Polarisedimenticolia bacterium]|nr:menaquinone biosynthesis decarboxylase [Candidatus Polarisedimenticolia bacterium]